MIWYRWLLHSLQGKLLLFILMGTLIPLLVLGGVAYTVSIGAITRQSAALTQSIVQEKSANIHTLMNQSQSLVRNILSNPQFQNTILSGEIAEDYDRLSTESAIGEMLGNYLHMDGLVSIDVSMLDGRNFHVGEMLEDSRLDLIQRDMFVRECESIQYGLCWPGITPNMLVRSRHGLIIPAIKVLRQLDRESMVEAPVGILQLAFSLDSFYERIHSKDTQGISHIVVDPEWRVIYHPNKSRINTRLEANTIVSLQGEEGRIRTEFEGKQSELVYQRLSGMDWKLIGVIPVSPLEEKISKISWVTGLFLLFSILLTGFGMLYITRQIIMPIQKITAAFKQVQENRLESPSLPKSSVSEIKILLEGLRSYIQSVQKEREQADELQKAYESLKQTQKQLVESEKMASLGGLVAGVAHEINTPLGISITAVSLIQERLETLHQKMESGQLKRQEMEHMLNRSTESSTMALSNLERASRLVQSFKQVAVDQSVEEMRTIKLKHYLEDLIFSLQPQFSNRKIHLELECPETLRIKSYPGFIAQVITNLIMNALTHAYEKEDSGEIRLQVECESGEVRMTFSDDGKGISSKNLEKIFEPFFTTRRNKGGTGLGLHIIYNIITQKLRGTIQCSSKSGEGACFEIRFPSEVW